MNINKLKRLKRARALRRAIFAKARKFLLDFKKGKLEQKPQPPVIPAAMRGFDPELLYVECGRCGAPVLWESGKATELMKQAGIDPMELDSSCILVTDSCPACGSKNEYSVRIFRIAANDSMFSTPPMGHA